MGRKKLEEARVYLRCSSSVSNFKDKVLKNWPVEEYQYPRDKFKPTVFFGMYHEKDLEALQKHEGRKIILWCGSDILNITSKTRGFFIRETNVCENLDEWIRLFGHGILAGVCPTFAGDVKKYQPIKNRDGNNVWMCCHPGREKEYGLNKLRKGYIYHIYGVEGKNKKNVIFHGKVSEEQLDDEIKNYQIAYRPNEFDGFSEVIAKGILMEQEIWSAIAYPKTYDRDYWIEQLTNFNWLKS